ncbi:potassium channel family protein [Halopiger xanaduensis]|uniref:potassium channel family protein n=1 Tax=Halopiger xanaduensis TaxID=387343 RepID=UPI000A2ED67C|nr:potassium channel family protein [Halopiger xanaduensis]
MRLLSLAIGVACLLVAIVDLFWTTLWDDKGAGPLSSRLMTSAWHRLRTVGGDRGSVLSLGGPLILALNLLTWVGLIWLGWTLVFAGGENALVHSRPTGPVTWIGRFYFVAQTMFTMGNGDFYPGSSAWQIAASLTTASGMLFVTLGVSYVISVLEGVIGRRSYANSVLGVGKRGETFVTTGWNGEDFDQFHHLLDSLSAELSDLGAQHKIHPILHYYRSEDLLDSSARAVVVFDEALTLLRFGIPEEHRPNSALIGSARSNAKSYLEAYTDTIEPADRAPPAPDLDRLREAGVPTVSDEEFADALDDLEERRRQLRAVIEASGRKWPSKKDD